MMGRNAWAGRLFALPFYIGFLFFVVNPIVLSIRFAFSDVSVEIGGYNLDFTGMANLQYIFNTDIFYKGNLRASVLQLLWQVPVILVASLFIALILKSEFRGRTIIRAIFFLPVIIASGIIMDTIRLDVTASSAMSGSVVAGGVITQSTALRDLMVSAGFGEGIVSFFTNIADNIFNVMWKSGVQMLLFLAGLQTISPSLYEASAIEGATKWEDFWKITLPMLKPIILVNCIYTIVDCFTASDNPVMRQVLSNVGLMELGLASAMLWVYCTIITVVLCIVFFAFSRSRE